MRHADIWRAIDGLAAANGLSPSALARRAGLDATAFNPSKRQSKDGRPRWPSTESIARALDAVDATFDDFADFLAGRRAARHGDVDARTPAPPSPGRDTHADGGEAELANHP